MALVYVDRVKETTTTTGTGTYTLAGAQTGFQAFSAVGDGNTCYYAITDGTDWEVGLGTYTLSGTTLARTSVLASSNGGSAVSWSAGSKSIWLDYPASAITTAGGLTLLGTLTTTSGSTQSLTNIPSTYRHLVFVVDGVSATATHSLSVAFSSNNGSSYGSGNTMYTSALDTTLAYGAFTAYRTGVSGSNKIGEGGFAPGVGSAIHGFAETSITGVINAVQFAPSAGTFDAGQIFIYGML